MTDKQINAGIVAIRQLLADGTIVQQHSMYGYTIVKKDDTTYCVDTGEDTCDCPAYRECKHIRACRVLEALVV